MCEPLSPESFRDEAKGIIFSEKTDQLHPLIQIN
jgi:hypothetical protein